MTGYHVYMTGYSLLELLITLFLLSVMLLGLDVMQLTALRQTKAAYNYRVGMEEADIMKQRLKYINNESLETAVASWNQQIKAVLPAGRGALSVDRNVIIVSWGEISLSDCKKNIIGVSGCVVLH